MSNPTRITEKNLAALTADFSTLIHIDSIIDSTGQHQGKIADGGLTDDLQPTLNGYLPGAEGLVVRVFLNGSVAGYSVVRDDGKWSYTLEDPLTRGTENQFQVVVLDPADGNTLWLSNVYNVNTTEINQDANEPPTTPVIDSVVDDVKGYNGHIGELQDGALTNDARPTLSGHAEAGAVIDIYDNGVLLGSTTVAVDGKWTFTPQNAMSDGAHSLSASAVNSAGESAKTASFDIIVDTTIIKPVLEMVTDNQGAKQGDVADGGLTDDSRPVLTGHAEANSRVDIHVFGSNGKQLYYESVTAGADGTWSYQPKAFTSHGTYSFGISGVDQAGNAWRDYGDKYSIQFVGENQDTSAPDAPVITSVYDDVGVMQGELANGGLTDDAKLKISGTAEANSIVTISHASEANGHGYIDGSTVADAQGNWTFQMTDGFTSYGNRFITATATDTAGNISAPSAEYVVNYVASNQDAPYTSGIEQFGDAANEHGYSFITAQGVEVTSTVSLMKGSAPTGITNGLGGQTYLGVNEYMAADVHVTLPGIADTVTIVGTMWNGPFNSDLVTFYNAQGNVIEVTAFTDSNYADKTLALEHVTATAVNGEAIASFTMHDITFVAGVQWESATAAHTVAQQVHSFVDSDDDATLVSQTEIKPHTDITDNIHNTLQLTLNDILSEAHDNLFIQDGHKQLAVTGDAGDVVELKVEDIRHDWQDAGQVTAGGVHYEVYQHADLNIELLVQQGVELHQVS